MPALEVNDTDTPGYQRIFSQCPPEAIYDHATRKKHNQAVQDTCIPLSQAFDMIFQDQHTTIDHLLSQYPFLLDKSAYTQPIDLECLSDVNDVYTLIKIMFIVHYAHTKKSKPPLEHLLKTFGCSSQHLIDQALSEQNLNKALDQLLVNAPVRPVLFVAKIIRQETPLALKALPCPAMQLPMIDIAVSLAQKTIVIPVPSSYTDHTLWSTCHNKIQGIFPIFYAQHLNHHLVQSMLIGEMCNSPFILAQPDQSLLQALAQHMLHTPPSNTSWGYLMTRVPHPFMKALQFLQFQSAATEQCATAHILRENMHIIPGTDYLSHTRFCIGQSPEHHSNITPIIMQLYNCSEDGAHHVLQTAIRHTHATKICARNLSQAEIICAREWHCSLSTHPIHRASHIFDAFWRKVCQTSHQKNEKIQRLHRYARNKFIGYFQKELRHNPALQIYTLLNTHPYFLFAHKDDAIFIYVPHNDHNLQHLTNTTLMLSCLSSIPQHDKDACETFRIALRALPDHIS